MSRRMTLGPISSSSMNSRTSMGPQRTGKAARHSLAPNASSGAAPGRTSLSSGTGRRSSVAARRSSAYTGKASSGTGRISDPRPIGDRAFTNQCIRTLIKYLTEHGYNSAISPKILTRPTNKQFLEIMTFLIHQIDPHFVIGQKYDADITMFLKGLNYPVGISKASLTAVGSPHTWPGLLACMAWLVELLSYDEEAAANEPEGGGGGDAGEDYERLFLDYLGRSYEAFLWYDEGKDAALCEELQETFKARSVGIRREVETLGEELAALRTEHATLAADKSPVTTLKSRRAELISDRRKFEELVGKLDERHAAARQTVDARRAECQAKEAELANLRDACSDLERRVAAQDVSAQDAERMAAERKRLQDGLRSAADRKEAAQQQLWTAEAEARRRLEALEAAVAAYNDGALRLHLIPSTAKHAGGSNFELLSRTSGLGPEEVEAGSLLSRDVRGELRPLLRGVRSQFVQRSHHARARLLEVQDDVEAARERRAEGERAVEAGQARLRQAEQQHAREQEALERKLQDVKDLIAATEADIAQLREDAANKDATRQQHEEATRLRLEEERARRAHDQRLEAQRQHLVAAFDRVAEHKVRVEQRLASLLDLAEDALREVEGVEGVEGAEGGEGGEGDAAEGGDAGAATGTDDPVGLDGAAGPGQVALTFA